MKATNGEADVCVTFVCLPHQSFPSPPISHHRATFRPATGQFPPITQSLLARSSATFCSSPHHFPPRGWTLPAHLPDTYSRPSPHHFPPIARRLPAPRLDTASFCFGAINPLHVFINCDPTDQSLPVANRKKLINVAVSTYTLLVILAALLKYPWRCHIR